MLEVTDVNGENIFIRHEVILITGMFYWMLVLVMDWLLVSLFLSLGTYIPDPQLCQQGDGAHCGHVQCFALEVPTAMIALPSLLRNPRNVCCTTKVAPTT